MKFRMLLDHIYTAINRVDSSGNSALLLAATTFDGLSPKTDATLDILISQPHSFVNIQDHRDR